ncbi:hypothetical protein O181_093666 [Austropuccinia psidii MF-1]|uniref:Reverse transcriptase domain-containing protein n=1 Tax=Austropuccinia psidii MF-1 TaxID=1389203 RepID=A0A9Q3J1X6_9BASI|nr:hypothetical protein [Austropuccinia psidii MF-1]
MEATIQSNQMDADKEEARPGPDLASLPQERHFWRMPEFPPFPKYQVQDDEMEDLSTKNINDYLKILKDNILKLFNNTNQFAIHLARSDRERQKLKDKILAHLEHIHKRENAISTKDVRKLEEWPKFSGEGEYNHNKLIRTINMFQEHFNIPDELIVVLINDVNAEINLDTGALCTCIGKDYLQIIQPEWKNYFLPIEGVKFSSSSNNMFPLGILDTRIVFPHPAGSVRMNTEIVVMENCTSQHIILGTNYLNICGIYINNHKYRYLTIGENKRQKFSFSNIPKQISIVSSNKDTYKEEFVTKQLVEAQINPSLSLRMRKELINVSYTYKNAFASDNEPLGAVTGNEVDITLNIDRPYPPVLRRPAYPASPRAREALEKHIQELIQLGVLRKVGHNEEVYVTPPVIIAWNNDKSKMAGDFRALNTYTVPDRYPIPIILENLTQLCKEKDIASVDGLKGFHQTFLALKTKKSLRIITHCGIYEYLRMPFYFENEPSHYQRIMNTIFPTELY